MRTVIEPITVTIDGHPTTSETTLASVTPHVVVVTTVLPDVPLTVVSTFMGAADLRSTVVHMSLGRRPAAQQETRKVARDQLPVTHAQELCVLEHAAALRSELGRHVAHVTIDVSDEALRLAVNA